MLCPNCKNELMVDHTTQAEIEGQTTTSYFYSCLTPQCPNYRKIINGSEEGERGDDKGEEGMKKAMLSQPMAGKTEEEIVSTRNKAIEALEAQGYAIVNTLFTDEWYSKDEMTERGVVQIPLCFLAKSLENMSLCHAAYFCKGWENTRGCKLEHEAATAYGLEVIYEQ